MANEKKELVIRLEFIGTLKSFDDPVAVAMRKLIVMCDEDFIPPLSYRADTVTPIAKMDVHEKNLEPYFKMVSKQNNVVAYCDDEIVAFMSFRHDYPHDHFNSVVQDGDVINYVSTICVDKDFRRHGIAKSFYDLIENKNNDLPQEVYGDCVATRTWDTNESHIKLLEKRGYELTDTLPEDRTTKKDEKLDTVYYAKRLTSAN